MRANGFESGGGHFPARFFAPSGPANHRIDVAGKKKGRTMNPLIQSKNTTILPVLIALTLGCFGVSPQARAVDPPPDGGYPNFNTAEGEDALFSLTTGGANTAIGSDALYSNTTGSDNLPLIWKAAGSLNTARFGHTATLLQNGMVLVTGGEDSNFLLPRARNCSTRRAVPGLLQTASTPHALLTQRRCYKTAWSLLQGETISTAFPERRTLRPGGRDLDRHRQPQHRTR